MSNENDTVVPIREGSAVEAAEHARVLLHMPVDVRSLSLAILATLGVIFALQWAKAVVVPVLLGLMLSYALTPLVDQLARWRLPRALGAGLLIISIVGGVVWGGLSLREDVDAFVESLPQVTQAISQAMRAGKTGGVGAIAKVQQAAAEITKAANEAPAASGTSTPSESALRMPAVPERKIKATTSSPTDVTRVVVEKPSVDIRDYLWTGTLGLASLLGEAAIIFFVALFLMSSGNTFRRKMVKLAGPKLSQKRVIVEALDEVTEQIQRYLLVQLGTSVLVGILTGLAFLVLGVNHPAVWGVVAGVTNLIPYVGAFIVGASSALVGLLQFASVDMAFIIGGTSFAVHAIVGNLLTPWLTGRSSRMSPFAVFIGVLAFGWLWGAAGLFLGVPILMVVKTVCDRVDELKPVGEFLGA